MDDYLAFDQELVLRIQWLLRLRWLAVIGTLAAIAVASALFPGQLPYGEMVSVVMVIAAYNLAFELVTRSSRGAKQDGPNWSRAVLMAGAQIVLDLLALTVLLHLAGGVVNPCFLFYVLHVIIASVLLPRRLSFAVAGLASFLFITLGLLEFSGVLTHNPLPGLAASPLYRHVPYLLVSGVAMAVTMFSAVYMASSISVQLRANERDLRSATSAAEARSRELEVVTGRLRSIDEERTRFMMMVSHELRAPLNTIYSVLEFATGHYASAEKTQEMLLRAKRRVTEMLTLINELLSLAKAREEQFEKEETELTQVGEVLQDVVKLMRVEAESKDLFLGVNIGPDVPAVWVNPDRVKLVWTNLLSNAIKYTEPGGIIVASLTRDGDKVKGSVRDTGIGIALEDQPKIFTDFFRTKDARRVSAIGTGIGLSLVKRIVENAGGQVALKSEIGKGTEFFFELPAGT